MGTADVVNGLVVVTVKATTQIVTPSWPRATQDRVSAQFDEKLSA